MAFETGTASKGVGNALVDSAHYQLLVKFKTFVESTLPVAERWVVQRSSTSTDDHETIWKAPGLASSDDIYIGIKTYQSVGSDIYNLAIMACDGYVSGNTFSTQPNAKIKGVPAWNQDIQYWFVGDGRNAICVMRIGVVYTSFVLGFYLPYATPGQYPYPICVGGCFDGEVLTRYSDTSYKNWWKGGDSNDPETFSLREANGAWTSVYFNPYDQTSPFIRNTSDADGNSNGYYGLIPLVGMGQDHSDNMYGVIDKIFFISGFNNVTENTIVINAVTYVVFKDVYRTGFMDFMALKQE